MSNISEKKRLQVNKQFFKDNEELFVELFDKVLWPIIEPLTGIIERSIVKQLKDDIWNLLFKTLSSFNTNKDRRTTNFTKVVNEQTASFINDLIRDFTQSFYEEMMDTDDPQTVLDSLKQLIDQQIIISWVGYLEKTITPLIIFESKEPTLIIEIKTFITRILLAIAQSAITVEEAENQVKTILKNNYEISDTLILFISSYVKTFGNYKDKYGLSRLAEVGSEVLKFSDNTYRANYEFITKAIEDAVFERDRILAEWKNNVLIPTCIGLKIAEKNLYNNFIAKTVDNFELFLDQRLTADDFEKRVDKDLREFGGDDEKLISPIRDSIASSVKFLEVARIDDPSLSLLMMLIEEEREEARRNFT